MIFAFQAIKKKISPRQNREEFFCLLLISSHHIRAISVKRNSRSLFVLLLFIPVFYYNFVNVSLYYVLELPERVRFDVKYFAVA